MEWTEQDFTRIVKIEKLLATGVIQENIQELRESYARQEYIQAIGVLKEILRDSEGRGNGARKTGSPGKPDKIFNIIPFIGERGTGKTSTMLSFANMLADFDLEKRAYHLFLTDEEDRLRPEWGMLKFVVLQYIDISVLKNREDIMAIIMARMLKYVQRVVNGGNSPQYGMPAVRQEELRQLYQCFDQTYRDLLNLTQGNQGPEGESALRRLQNLNSSYSLSEKFQELVNLFREFLCRNEGDLCTPYLVISLDDIDLYEEAGSSREQRKDAYTILGQIYEYLQIPGIIVLTTFDEKRLTEACARHIKKTFPYIKKGESFAQSVQYIQKVILPKYKIYMPSLSYADYPGERQLSISLGENRDLRQILFPGVTDTEKEGALPADSMKLTPKSLILKYLTNVYGCCFDSMGKKQHFFEERTLRKIKNRFLALRINDDKTYPEADEKQREQRYMHLLSYIYNQFIGEKLAGSKEITLFRGWLSMPVERRSKEILEHIRSERANLNPGSAFGPAANEGTYSYGELIRNLYISSRCEIFSKEMVHCILASYSLVLPNLYWKFRAKGYDITSEEYRSLRSMLGTSISGRWSNEILYTVFVRRENLGVSGRGNIGSISTSRCNQALSILMTKKREAGFRWLLSTKNKARENQRELFQNFLRMVEILGMFFTNVRETEREEQREWKRANYGFYTDSANHESEGEEPTKVISLSGKQKASEVLPQIVFFKPKSQYACFNILNFAVNSFLWEEYFEALHSSLLDAILDWAQKQPDQSLHDGVSGRRQDLMRRLQSCSLKSAFKEWAHTCGCCAIPFQHFDMVYNILKRQRDASDHGLPEQAEASEFWSCCKRVYDNIAAALREQDQFYQNPGVPKFEDVFNRNPFRKAFSEYGSDQEFCAQFTELANVLIAEDTSLRQDVLLRTF